MVNIQEIKLEDDAVVGACAAKCYLDPNETDKKGCIGWCAMSHSGPYRGGKNEGFHTPVRGMKSGMFGDKDIVLVTLLVIAAALLVYLIMQK